MILALVLPLLGAGGARPHAEALASAAMVHYAEHYDAELARKELEAAAAADPTYALPHYDLGVLAELECDWAGAKKRYEEALELEHDGAWAVKARDAIARLDARIREASTPEGLRKQRYERAVATSRALLELAKPNDALAQALVAEQLDPSRWEAYAAAGGALQQIGSFGGAADALKHAARLAPAETSASLSNLADEATRRARVAAAVAEAMTQVDSGRPLDAAARLEAAWRASPQDGAVGLAAAYAWSAGERNARALGIVLALESSADAKVRADADSAASRIRSAMSPLDELGLSVDADGTVEDVAPGSLGSRAGVPTGWQIASVGATEVSSREEANSRLRAASGTTVELALTGTEDDEVVYTTVDVAVPAHAAPPSLRITAAQRQLALHAAQSLAAGDSASAIEAWSDALDGTGIDLEPEHADWFLGRGEARAKNGDFEAAILDFSRALALRPDSVDARRARADAEVGANRPKLALNDCDEALRLSESDRGCRMIQVRAWQALGDHDAALRACDTIPDRDHDPEVLGLIAQSQIALGRHSDARDTLSELHALRPDDAESANLLAAEDAAWRTSYERMASIRRRRDLLTDGWRFDPAMITVAGDGHGSGHATARAFGLEGTIDRDGKTWEAGASPVSIGTFHLERWHDESWKLVVLQPFVHCRSENGKTSWLGGSRTYLQWLSLLAGVEIEATSMRDRQAMAFVGANVGGLRHFADSSDLESRSEFRAKIGRSMGNAARAVGGGAWAAVRAVPRGAGHLIPSGRQLKDAVGRDLFAMEMIVDGRPKAPGVAGFRMGFRAFGFDAMYARDGDPGTPGDRFTDGAYVAFAPLSFGPKKKEYDTGTLVIAQPFVAIHAGKEWLKVDDLTIDNQFLGNFAAVRFGNRAFYSMGGVRLVLDVGWEQPARGLPGIPEKMRGAPPFSEGFNAGIGLGYGFP